MNNKYQIIVGSPVAYEELTADIVINSKYIARVQKEEGNEKIIVEFFEDALQTKIYLHDFIEALQEAKILLLK